VAHSRLYGRALAEVHTGLHGYVSAQRRGALDAAYLLDQPLQMIYPFLDSCPTDRAYLVGLAEKLRARMAALAGRLEWGPCHGDMHGGNCHLAAEGRLTLFDFDCCGPGWRAFDLGTFRWACRVAQQEDAVWEAFVEGYTERRPLHRVDLDAVPLFGLLRHVWFLGLQGHNALYWGSAYLTSSYLERSFTFLRAWEAEVCPPP
jgi:Ser/Thr protein kinase RdoA (MazF antagonist)